MICSETYLELLESYLDEYGIETTNEQRRLLLTHLDLVVEKNKVMNLTRILTPEDAVQRHVVDSLLILPSVKKCELSRRQSFVDIGTGAGFPGVPLGIVTDYEGLLIDSVGKKISAVNEFVRDLGLTERLKAESIRVEDLARSNYASYDLVVARAVADLGVLVEYASPLLKQGGHLVVSKARIGDDEVRRGTGTAERTGMKYVSRETYELPEDAGHREILTYVREGKSKVKLPRQTGMAKHKPLVS